MANTDYERMIEQFRSQLDDVWNRRKVDRLRSQVDELRRNTDDLVNSFNRVMSTGADVLGETQRRLAKQARESVEEATGGMAAKGGFSWWVPVAILGVIGAAYWLYNSMMSGAPGAERPPHTNFQAGFTPPMTSSETPSQEQR